MAQMPDSAPLDEAALVADLVARVRAGDVEAEGQLYKRYHRGLYFFIRRLTRDPDAAQDLCQEAFVILLRKLRTDGLDEPKKLNSYLYGIARKLSSRSIALRRRTEDYGDNDVLDRVADSRPDPYLQVSRDETLAMVMSMFDELTVERDRQLLLRFWVYDEDKDTICAALDIDRGHFHRVIYRARNRFRELLRKAEERNSLILVKE
ncbi:MAG: sigma-70 family RNA polymerase sigma factor [Gammaproteobacteria bacterium]